MPRYPSPQISLLRFADEIELVPFDQPLQLSEGMFPVGRTPSTKNETSSPAYDGAMNSSAKSESSPVVSDYSSPFRAHILPLFNPAA